MKWKEKRWEKRKERGEGESNACRCRDIVSDNVESNVLMYR